MREIKFRAVYKPLNTVYDVSEIMWSDRAVCLINSKHNYRLESLDDVDLLQFTGLKDKNGKEIYEGDVLAKEYGNMRGVVAFHPAMAQCLLVDESEWKIGSWVGVDEFNGAHSHAFTQENPVKDQQVEIIGNIYENPELLK